MENENYGVIIEQKESDWVCGVNSPIVYKENQKDANWFPFLPTKEKQLINKKFETFACVSFSASNEIETQINQQMAIGLISPENMKKIIDWGYLDDNGKFNVSDEFIAILSGTGYKDGRYGNSASRVFDAIKKYGLVPQKMLDRSNVNTADEWYAPIPQEIIDFGQNFLSIFKIEYEQIKSGGCTPATKEFLEYHLKHAPLQLLAHCGGSTDNQIFSTQDCESQHATEIYSVDDYINQFDTYEPFCKKLTKDYIMPYIIKAVVTLNTDEAVKQQKIAILKKMIALYQQLIEMIQNKTAGFVGAIKNIIK